MQTRLLFTLLIILAAYEQSLAQETARYPMLTVKVSPLSLSDPLTSTFAPSLTYSFHPRWAIHLEYGFQFEALKVIDRTEGFLEDRYYEIRPEAQYMLPSLSDNRLYLALEGFYIPQRVTLSNGYVDFPGTGQAIFFDRAEGDRLTSGLVLKGGLLQPLGHHFLTEFFFGIGYRRRSIEVHDYQNARLGLEPFEEWFADPWTRPGVKHTVQLSLGFRLGWVLAWRKSLSVRL